MIVITFESLYIPFNYIVGNEICNLSFSSKDYLF